MCDTIELPKFKIVGQPITKCLLLAKISFNNRGEMDEFEMVEFKMVKLKQIQLFFNLPNSTIF